MDLITVTLIVIVFYSIYRYFQNRTRYFEELGIPYKPAIPLFGNMATAIFRKKHVTSIVKDIYSYLPEAKYLGAFNFIRPVIVIKDPEIIKNITIKNFDNFPDHQSIIDSSLDPLFGGNLFSMAGDKWREARNLLTPAFTSSKMKAMFELMVKCAENLNNHLDLKVKDPKNEIYTKDLFTRYTNDVIASCAFGINIDSLKDPKNTFYVLGRQATNFEGLLSIKFFLARAFPQLIRIFRIKLVADKVARFFTDVVNSTVEMRDEKKISRPDMIQLMMDARGKTIDLKLDITEMTAQAFIFFFGGFDTTSTQMCIISHELILNPEIQKTLQSEIDEVLAKTKGQPTYEAINSMAYLDAIFNESMRKHTQANVIDRLCTKPFDLPPALPGGKPFTIQPGMNIWIPVYGIHHDKSIYPNPEKFDPDRYLNKKVTINQVDNLGFGIGPRGCIGNRFAILETKILLFFLLSKFTLKPSSKTVKHFEYNPSNLSIAPKGGYWMSIEPRIFN